VCKKREIFPQTKIKLRRVVPEVYLSNKKGFVIHEKFTVSMK
jgi:hypothetical protein